MPSIGKIHSILELLRENYKTGLTNKEISITLKIPQSTCYRILSTLKKYDYIQQKPNDVGYILGFMHLRFAQALTEGMDETAVIDPHLENLHQATERTTLFTRWSGQYCVVMEVRGSVNTRISVGVGEIMPLHCSATGKVIMAFIPEKQQEKLLSQLDLEWKTPATICDMNVLKKKLMAIRETGTSYNLGETNQGINSMATPLFNSNNQVFGALVLVGTSHDLPLETLRSYSGLFHKTGRQITKNLGGQYPDWIKDTD